MENVHFDLTTLENDQTHKRITIFWSNNGIAKKAQNIALLGDSGTRSIFSFPDVISQDTVMENIHFD